MISGLSFGLALLCAAVMGLAIQRGSTCTVAAVQEWRDTRRLTRLGALVETSLWVATGLLLARQAGHPMSMPVGHALGWWTLVGAALLGLGAVVNQACVVGTVARLGSGQWAYAFTPLGFYLGCLTAGAVDAPPRAATLGTGAPLVALPAWLAWPVLAAALWRALALLRRSRGVRGATWSPHIATLVIGIAFVILFLTAGAWAYTDLLAELARTQAEDLGARSALGAALLGGALVGGRLSGQLRWAPARFTQLLRCAGGGWLMGWGSLLIPGSNDGLVLLGLPLLWPYAWASFAVMALVIFMALHALDRR